MFFGVSPIVWSIAQKNEAIQAGFPHFYSVILPQRAKYPGCRSTRGRVSEYRSAYFTSISSVPATMRARPRKAFLLSFSLKTK